MITDILKNMNLFVDGRGHAGKVDELNPPKMTLKTEEHRAGGMDVPVELDMGMEKMECDFSLSAFEKEVLKLYGLAPGKQIPLTIRGVLESEDGTVTPVIINLRGQVKELDYGSWKPGDKAQLKVMVALRYYKLTHGQDVIHEIDAEGMIRIINGTDQLANQRTALGL
jgi:P2 family phage contractile tail tube protein